MRRKNKGGKGVDILVDFNNRVKPFIRNVIVSNSIGLGGYGGTGGKGKGESKASDGETGLRGGKAGVITFINTDKKKFYTLLHPQFLS